MTWQADATAAIASADSHYANHIAPAARDMGFEDANDFAILDNVLALPIIAWAWFFTDTKPVGAGEDFATASATAASHIASADADYEDAGAALAVGAIAAGLSSPLVRPGLDQEPGAVIDFYRSATSQVGFDSVPIGGYETGAAWLNTLVRWHLDGHRADVHWQPPGVIGTRVLRL